MRSYIYFTLDSSLNSLPTLECGIHMAQLNHSKSSLHRAWYMGKRIPILQLDGFSAKMRSIFQIRKVQRFDQQAFGPMSVSRRCQRANTTVWIQQIAFTNTAPTPQEHTFSSKLQKVKYLNGMKNE